MLSHDKIAHVEYIVDSSDVVNIIESGMTRDRRGRPFNTTMLRTLIIGWLLTNHEHKTMRITTVHQLLTTRLDSDTQRRLGVLVKRNGKESLINRSPLDTMVRRIEDGLGYGTGTHPDLDDTERQRRLDVITAASDALLDVFNIGFTSSYYAIDASGIWSWGKSSRRRPNIDEITSDGAPNPEAQIAETDPDAQWGSKTAKDGRQESVFGYHLHALVRVPGRTRHGHHQRSDSEPRLVHRIGITPANADIVDVSLNMVDRVTTGRHPAAITDLIVDSHYHYKSPGRWIKQLLERDIKQHHDLRKDEVRFVNYEQMRFLSGDAHCPATPDGLQQLTPLPPDPSPQQIAAFHKVNNTRQQFAMVRHTSVNAEGRVRYQCPALAGEIGCPHRPGTVPAAIATGRPTLTENDVAFDDMPACCTQKTVQIRLPDLILKHTQPHFWGSQQWREQYNKRTYVESFFGNLKNEATENVSRGMHRHVGITLNHLQLTIAATNFNLRTLRKWHETTGHGDPNHPLLSNIAPPTNVTPVVTRGRRRPRWAA